MRLTLLVLLLINFCSLGGFAADFAQPSFRYKVVSQDIDSLPQEKRLIITTASHALLWVGSFIALNQAWYKDYPKSSFQFFNDNAEWKQMDKAGHVWSTYQLTRISASCWEWAGIDQRNAVLWGAASAMAYQSIIEIQDGFSKQWGFSWGDMVANIAGAGTAISQQLLWNEQRVQVKMSYFPYQYENDLLPRRNQVFGTSGAERILKDYNSQTYWLSANIHSFFKHSNFPRWLNIAIGYGTEGVLGARRNVWTDADGNIVNRRNIPRLRQFYLSPDIDLTKIKTRSVFVRSLLFIASAIKIPAPTIELNSQGKLKGHLLYF